MFRSSILGVLIVVGCSSVAFSQTILHVRVDAAAGGDGTSWATAFDDLQDALDAAGQDFEIWVAAGVYRPDRGTGDRESTFNMQSSVALYGGFLGNELTRDQRDPQSNETVLNGDLNGNDAEDPTDYFDCCFEHPVANTCGNATCSAAVCDASPSCCDTAWNTACAALAATLCDNICSTPTRSDNTYHVVSAVDVDQTAVLDGFTVTGGHANGLNFGPDPSSQDQGSGLNNYHSTPTVANCLITENWSNNHGAVNDHGGITLTDCTLQNNYSGNIGGGLYIHHVGMSATTITDCIFDGNVTEGRGAGAYNKGNGQTTFTGCTFSNNSSLGFGAGAYNAIGSITFTNCSFVGNTSASYGGGLGFYGNMLTLTECDFTANTGLYGGGLYIGAGDVALSNCDFLLNFATTESGGGGGGMYSVAGIAPILNDCTFIQNGTNGSGGGLQAYNGGDSVLTRCLFAENTARIGGGLSHYFGGQTRLTDCSFFGNSADFGGGAYLYRDEPTFVNCVFNNNTATNSGGGLITANDTVTLINCTIYGNSANLGGGMYTQRIDPAPGEEVVTLTNSILWGNSDSQGTAQSAQIYPAFDAAPIVNYSCVQGWDGTLEGVLTIADDPLFVNPNGEDNVAGTVDDDLRLVIGSPSVDAGDNDAIPSDVETDLDGNPRIFANVVDMGAYELQTSGAAIPATSTWGLIGMTLLTLAVGTLVFRSRSGRPTLLIES